MIVIDASAVLSVVFEEDSAERVIGFLDTMARGDMSGANYLECCIALRRRRPKFTRRDLDAMLAAFRTEVSAIDPAQIGAALQADAQYGRGTGHPARLNFGDCLAYALAKVRRAPLLFIGNDFIHTDIEPALR